MSGLEFHAKPLMFWVGEKTEVIVAYTLEDAARFIGEDASDPDFKGGQVDYERTATGTSQETEGGASDGEASADTLSQAFENFLESGRKFPEYIWSAYGD